MNKSNSIDHLKNKEIWSIEEVLELLCGPSNPSTVIRGATHKICLEPLIKISRDRQGETLGNLSRTQGCL